MKRLIEQTLCEHGELESHHLCDYLSIAEYNQIRHNVENCECPGGSSREVKTRRLVEQEPSDELREQVTDSLMSNLVQGELDIDDPHVANDVVAVVLRHLKDTSEASVVPVLRSGGWITGPRKGEFVITDELVQAAAKALFLHDGNFSAKVWDALPHDAKAEWLEMAKVTIDTALGGGR